MSTIAILFPRLDLPFKEFPNLDYNHFILPEEQHETRKYWRIFLSVLIDTLQSLGHDYTIYTLPNWEITQDAVDALTEDIIFIPHRDNKDINTPKDKNVFFYMQVMTKWLFTIDQQGWGSLNSNYPINLFNISTDPTIFKRYQQILINNNESKFNQPPRKNKLSLQLTKDIPLTAYLFFPLQVPHDQSIQKHANICPFELTQAMCNWANENRRTIVFKKHPINLKSMIKHEEIINQCKWARFSNANIHDLIGNSVAVVTINSGVGFEALLHEKPVVTFGKVEYDCVTIQANLDDLPIKLSEAIESADTKIFYSSYTQFFNYFTQEFCVDLSISKLADHLIIKMIPDLQ